VAGLLGYALVFPGSIVGWFNLTATSTGGPGQILFLPVSAFEIILLPLWLLCRGFKQASSGAASSERPIRSVPFVSLLAEDSRRMGNTAAQEK
jgi:hypothetical protein